MGPKKSHNYAANSWNRSFVRCWDLWLVFYGYIFFAHSSWCFNFQARHCSQFILRQHLLLNLSLSFFSLRLVVFFFSVCFCFNQFSFSLFSGGYRVNVGCTLYNTAHGPRKSKRIENIYRKDRLCTYHNKGVRGGSLIKTYYWTVMKLYTQKKL